MTKQKQNNQEKFELLKHKYFWEQKASEIGYFILHIGIILILALLLSFVMPYHVDSSCSNKERIYCSHFEYAVTMFLAGLVCWGILLILKWAVRMWIDSNWTEAEDRAKRELGLNHNFKY